MSVHGDLVGRLAQLRNIASRPELNEAFVLIQSYLSEKNRFAVRTLPVPNSNGEAVSIAVRLDSLALCSRDYFADKYPIRQEIQVDSFENAARVQADGTILKMNLVEHSKAGPVSVVLQRSRRCVGVKTTLGNTGMPNPVTKYFGNIRIAPENEDAIIEFEDIEFIGFQSSGYDFLTCPRGRFITFRRCAFYNTMVMVAAEDPLTAMQLSSARTVHNCIGKPNVVFENCMIDVGVLDKKSTGIGTSDHGTTTLLNCVVRNGGVGILGTEGAHIVMKHCVVENCMNGVGVGEKTRSLDMLNCFVSKNLDTSWFGGYGILVDTAGPAVIHGCRVERGQDVGIYIRGKNKHTSRATVTDCYITGYNNGVAIELGEVAVTVTSTVLRDNIRYGLIIYPTAIGTVALAQCSIVDNRMVDVLNGSPAQGMLTVDSVVQDATHALFELPEHLPAQRCGQRAGICDINCLNCGRKEEAGEKFKKCGKCEDVCYCSRECQKAHWKEQKKVCQPQGMAAANAVHNEMVRFTMGAGSASELWEVMQRCDPRKWKS